LEKVINEINNILWGGGMIILILGAGIYLTVATRFFQFRKVKMIFRETILSLFKDKSVRKSNDKKSISQLQAVSTALAATMGTGNIAGVASALTLGGAGAVFWMWVSSLFGMMIVFCENVLGIYYRYKNASGEWVGGPMVYLEKGLGSKKLGMVYAVFCVLASFGMGNITQINSISLSAKASFGVPCVVTGIFAAILIGIIIFGGLKRIGSVTEKLIPILSLAYILGSIIIIVINFKAIPSAFSAIFRGAFGLDSITGGICGAAIKQAVSVGLRRGVFSNEAGLGSTVMVHAASDIKSPIKQGMWGIFEVFLDTIVCCTLTALVILTSGAMSCKGIKLDGAALVIKAFESGFGHFSGIFVTASVSLFAFATVLGWSVFGLKAFEYVFGEGYSIYYKLIYVLLILFGATGSINLIWGISDIFNGFMAIPNLIGVLLLSPVMLKALKNYPGKEL